MSEQLTFPLPGSPALADQRFAVFYAQRLKPASTGRVEASALHAAYAGWAAEQGAEPIHFKLLKRLMVRRGHRHFHSDGAVYGGVALIPPGVEREASAEGVAATEAARLFALDLVARIDAITADIERNLGELAQLRARLSEALP